MSAETDLLKEILDNRTYAETELQEQRAEAKKDRLCITGQVWQAMDPDAVQERKTHKRPYLNSDEINQYINQVVNGLRANPRGITFAPTGNGANDAGAQFYENHTREIEYRSKASVIYARAAEDAINAGIGWLRLKTFREHIRTFNQNIGIEMIANSDQVLPDPSGVWPDSRDCKFLFYLEPWPRSAFQQKFPKAKAVSMTLEGAMRLAKDWVTRDIIQVGEYWKLESVIRRLVAYLPNDGDEPATQPEVRLVDELPDGKLPEGVQNLREEEVEDTRVRSWLTNGVEVLKEQKWPGKYIPFVSCKGKMVYLNDKLVLLSMTRLARDPAMHHAYVLTAEAEALGGVSRAQWVGYEGQFAKPDRWGKANHRPVAFLEAKVTVPGNPNIAQPLPLPQKQSWDPPIQNYELAIDARRRGIQSAMGILPQPTDAQRRNDASGVAYKERQAEGQMGSFHFVDAYDLMIERTGMIIEDLIDKVIDTARDIAVRKADGTAGIVRVNDPAGSAYGQGPQPQLSGDPIFTKGDYRCTISTGPATESQRQEATDFVDTMVSNLPVIAEIAGPQKAQALLAKAVKLKQLGPIGDEVADLLAPPPMTGPNGQPLSPELQAAQQQIQALQAQLQQAKQIIETKQAEKQAEMQGQFAIAKMKTDATSADKAADREVKLVVAELGAKVDRMALLLEASNKVGVRLDARQAALEGQRHDATEAAKDRIHEDLQGVKDRAHEHIQSTLAHGRAKELADQAAQQQADLSPDDTTDGAGA